MRHTWIGLLLFSCTALAGSVYLNGVKISVGVNNMFNRMPPYAPLSNPAAKNNNNVDVATTSPIGRLFFVSLTARF